MDTNETFYRDIGNKITVEREKLGFTQESFVEYMENNGMYLCSRVQLSRIENGNEKAINSLHLSDWMNLCDVFHCDMDYLLGKQEVKSRDNQFIRDRTGLSEKSIQKLTNIHAQEQPDPAAVIVPNGFINALSTLIESDSFLDLLELLLTRFTVSTIQELFPEPISSMTDASKALSALANSSAYVRFPNQSPLHPAAGELAEAMITSKLQSMFSGLKAAFVSNYGSTVNHRDNELYRTICSIMKNESCLTSIRKGGARRFENGEWHIITEADLAHELQSPHIIRTEEDAALYSPSAPDQRINVSIPEAPVTDQ